MERLAQRSRADAAALLPPLPRCGPQSNARLLLNYGIVDDANPADGVTLHVETPPVGADARAPRVRAALAAAGAASSADFKVSAAQPLPAGLLPYMRLALADEAALERGDAAALAAAAAAGPLSPANEATAVGALARRLRERLAGYKTSVGEDEATLASPTAGPRQKVAARLLRLEKLALTAALDAVLVAGTAAGVGEGDAGAVGVGVRVE